MSPLSNYQVLYTTNSPTTKYQTIQLPLIQVSEYPTTTDWTIQLTNLTTNYQSTQPSSYQISNYPTTKSLTTNL